MPYHDSEPFRTLSALTCLKSHIYDMYALNTMLNDKYLSYLNCPAHLTPYYLVESERQKTSHEGAKCPTVV